MASPLQSRPAALLAGLAVGAVILLVVPSSWLFRPAPKLAGAGEASGRKWACPMFCTMSDKPGNCPVCGMKMEPVTDHGAQVRLDARERYMAGVRTAMVARRQVERRVRALGKIRHDERLEGQVTAWVGGRIDDLLVDFTGVEVKAGQKIAELYAPELLSAQEELVSARKTLEEARSRGAEELRRHARSVYEASRRRLLLLGMPEKTVAAVEASGKAQDHVDVIANVGGTVLRKHVEQGDYVKTGQPLYSVVDLHHVWAMLEVFEDDAGSIFVGQQAEVQVPGLPGETFRGPVTFVDPVLDEHRRVLHVRVELENPDGHLKPGMFVDAEILVPLTAEGHVVDPAKGTPAGPVLLVPHAAVLEGAKRKLVYVMTQDAGPMKDGKERWPAIYEPRAIEVGFRVGDDRVVISGLQEGDEVVTRGQFLIDSPLQLTGKPSLMIPEAAGGAPASPHAGHGH